MPIRENLTTLDKHLRQLEHRGDAPGAAAAGVIGAIALAGKAIAAKVRRARIDDVLGDVGDDNIHGEAQQKLDVLADELVLHCMRERNDVGIFGSEEQDEAVVLRSTGDGARFAVLVDPLDGSSNVDVAVSVGTIFSVLGLAPGQDGADAALQPGTKQLAAGYILYGSSVVMMLTLGAGVDMYVLDPVLGEFVLVLEGLEMPSAKKIYSINEAYTNDFDDGVNAYLGFAHESGYAARYIGSMVADVHRTLLKGGVFLYPAMTKAPAGKLRLLYEGNPMGFLAEQAGGSATTGSGRILEVTPEQLHQRVPVILGSKGEVEQVVRHLG